jgi:hypothetical protein
LPKKVKKSKRDWQGEIYTPHGHNFSLAPLAPQLWGRAVSFSRAAFGNINEISSVTATFFSKIGYQI